MNDGIVPVDHGRDDQAIPEEKTASARSWIEHEAQAHVVAFALYAVDTTSFTSKADPFRFAHCHTIDGLIRSARQGLRHGAIDVIGDPAASCAFGIRMHLVFRETVLLAQGREGLGTFL